MSEIELISQQLSKNIKENLPGLEAQLKMAPYARKLKPDITETPRQSAVLILMSNIKNETSLTLIERPEYDGVHSKQIAFPGGKHEPKDKNLQQTAQRETHEEIGILPNEYEVIGQISPLYIPPSNFMVTPFLAFSTNNLTFVPDEKEVNSVIHIPLSEFNKINFKQEKLVNLSNGMKIKTPTYCYKNFTVWGATAMMMSEFEHLLESII